MSFKNPAGWSNGKDTVRQRPLSLIFAEGAALEVHTADLEKARLVIGWHRRHNAWYESRLKGYEQMPEEIEVAILGDLLLSNVVFQDVALGGIRLANPAVRQRWANVTFGARNAGRPEELIVPLSAAAREAITSHRSYKRLTTPR